MMEKELASLDKAIAKVEKRAATIAAIQLIAASHIATASEDEEDDN